MNRAQIERASVLWMLFWGAIAVDSAVTHRKSLEAVEKAVDADPVSELYEGPPEQHGSIQRWLLWRTPTLGRLRRLSRMTRWLSAAAPLIAVMGPPLLFALGDRERAQDA